jgi:hypothetical protein
MKKKIIGILVCILLIVTALSATGVINVQTTQNMKENNDLEPNLSTPVNSPGVITIKIVAQVYFIHDPNNLLGGAIQVDDTITGKYTYNSRTPDSNPDPHWGEYRYTSSTFGIEINAGGLDFKTNPSDVDFLMGIGNDTQWSDDYVDYYGLASRNNLQLSNGMLVYEIYWILIDDTCTALTSDALPTTAPVLSDWIQPYGLYMSGWDPSDPGKQYVIQANVTKVTRSRARDVQSSMQPILTWLFEHFANIFLILQQLIKL